MTTKFVFKQPAQDQTDPASSEPDLESAIVARGLAVDSLGYKSLLASTELARSSLSSVLTSSDVWGAAHHCMRDALSSQATAFDGVRGSISSALNLADAIANCLPDPQRHLSSLVVPNSPSPWETDALRLAMHDCVSPSVVQRWPDLGAASMASKALAEAAAAASGSLLGGAALWRPEDSIGRLSAIISESTSLVRQAQDALKSIGSLPLLSIDLSQQLPDFGVARLASVGLQEPLDQWRRPGTVDGDLFLLTDDHAGPGRKEEALHRMAKRINWAPLGRAAQAELAERARRAKKTVGEIKHEELCAAILLVLDTRDLPQYHRFGRHWLLGDDGRKVAVAPNDLDGDLYLEWFWNEVREAAGASLLERPFPPLSDVMDRKVRGKPACASISGDIEIFADPSSDPLMLLLDREAIREDKRRLLAALEEATPRQRELLALIAAGAMMASAARQLKMSPATARGHMFRLRQRIA